jgi:hypothetical protein
MDVISEELQELGGIADLFDESDLVHHDLLCPNCSNSTRGLFLEQDDNDLYTCMSCGLCNVERSSCSYRQVEFNRNIENILSSIVSKVRARGTPHTGGHSYERAFHLMERLRQYYLLEPRIDPAVERAIKAASEEYRAGHYYYDQLLTGQHRLKKADVKSLLRFMTKRAKEEADQIDFLGYCHVDYSMYYRIMKTDLHDRSFCTVYLEKWKSIVMILQPDLPEERQFKFMTESQVLRLEYKFRLYSSVWEELRWKGKLPKKRVGGHFPNFNTMILRICREENIPMSTDEFPPLTTPRTKKEFDKAYDLIRRNTFLVKEYIELPTKKKQLQLDKFVKP